MVDRAANQRLSVETPIALEPSIASGMKAVSVQADAPFADFVSLLPSSSAYTVQS